MATEYPRFWRLENTRVIPCDESEWMVFRKDARDFVLAKTYIEPGFLVQTQFYGKQASKEFAPALFRTSVFSDLGESVRTARTWNDAKLMHMMECQRIDSVVRRNAWSMIAPHLSIRD